MLTIEKKSLRVGQFVDTQHVSTGIRNYKQERWVHNSERLGKEDSMSVWYSIEELEEFLYQAKENGANGVRMYFSAYPKDFKKVPEYAGRQTIVLVASKGKRNEQGKIVNKDVYVQTENGANILAYNFGSVCPPYNCPGGKGGLGDGIAEGDDWGGIGTALVDRGDKGMLVV
jgi:hypothetical protein